MTSADLEGPLRSGAHALGVALGDAQVQQLLAYVALISKWNQVYNLTAVREPQDMLRQHLLDSLAVVPALRAQTEGRAVRLLDVGSGAGLPGVVLAICEPQWQVDCVDTVAKKAAFIQQAAASLGISTRLQGIHQRVEQLEDSYDVVCSRAFASLADFITLSARVLAPQGTWLAMKGKVPHDEIAALPASARVFHVEQLDVPGLEAERCIVWLKKAQAH